MFFQIAGLGHFYYIFLPAVAGVSAAIFYIWCGMLSDVELKRRKDEARRDNPPLLFLLNSDRAKLIMARKAARIGIVFGAIFGIYFCLIGAYFVGLAEFFGSCIGSVRYVNKINRSLKR